MSYTGSKASTSLGVTVSIGPLASATGSPTYTAIGEVSSASFSGAKRTVLNPTNFQSSMIEKSDALADPGQIKLTMNRVTNDAGQMALQAAWNAGGKYLFQVQEEPDASIGQTTTGNLYAFQAIISEGPTFDMDPNKLTVLSYTLDMSNEPVFTAGS
jgi:hypothetical protein